MKMEKSKYHQNSISYFELEVLGEKYQLIVLTISESKTLFYF